jgi:hypothetical protein
VIHDIGDQAYAASHTPGPVQVYAFYLIGRSYTVTHNVIYRTTGMCFQLSAYNTNPDPNKQGFWDSRIANNTCAYNFNSQGLVMNVQSGGTRTGVSIENNIFYQTCYGPLSFSGRCSTGGSGSYIEGGSATRHAIGLLDWGAQNVIIRNNVSFDTDDAAGTSFVTCAVSNVGTHNESWCESNGWATTTNNSTTTNPNLTNAPTTIPASPDFTLTSSSAAAINTGVAISGMPFNGSASDAGAFESFTFSSASIDTTFLDVTLGMNANVPELPASGITGFSVSCTGTNCGTPVIASANRLAGSDSIIRLTLSGIGGTGNCDVAQTWTVSYTPGNMTDSANIGGTLVQKGFAFSTQPVTEVCSGSGTTPPGGLLVHYLFDEGTGISVNDEANTNDGTLTNVPTWVTGKTGNAVHYGTSTDNYVAVPYGSGVNPSTQSISACMWVLPDSGTESAEKIFFSGSGSAGVNQRFYLSKVSGTWGLGMQSSGHSATEFAVVAGWTRVCVVANSGTDTATLYVNGVAGTGSSTSVKTYTSFTLAGNFKIGNDSPSDTSLRGETTIDDVKIWDTALTAQEVLDDYNSYGSPPTPTGTLEQKTHRWYKLRKTEAGAADPHGAVGATVPVMNAGAVQLVIQVDCTTANCDPIAARLLYNRNGGTFNILPNTFGADLVRFYGATADSGVLSGTVTCCLSGALASNDGDTQFVADAIPVFDLDQDASITLRYAIAVDPSATVGDIYCFKLYSQEGVALTAYEPSAGACLTVVGPSSGVGF